MTPPQGTRNSFLKRDDQTLARLANMVKNDTVVDGENVGLTGISKGRGNFVFSTLSPAAADAKSANSKRKSTNDAVADSPNVSKKARKSTAPDAEAAAGVFKKRLLDSLT